MTKEKTKETRLTGGTFWNPKVGDELVGRLVAIRQGQYTRDIYDLKVEGKIITIPSSSVLANVWGASELDKKFRIKFLGWGKDKVPEQKSGLYRNFDVFLIEEK